jgi:hypothetical protein
VAWSLDLIRSPEPDDLPEIACARTALPASLGRPRRRVPLRAASSAVPTIAVVEGAAAGPALGDDELFAEIAERAGRAAVRLRRLPTA